MDIYRKVIERLFSIKKIWGVHIWERDKDQYSIYVTLVENIKGVLYIRETMSFDDLSVLFSEKFASIPVCISFDSPNVLIKEVAANSKAQTIFNQLHIKNGDDFKLQLVDSVDIDVVFIIRNKLYNDLIYKLEGKLQILEFFLGPVSFNSCLHYMITESSKISYDILNFKVDVKSKLISRYSRKPTASLDENSLLIGNDYVSTEFVLPYCNVLNYFANNVEVPWLKTSVFRAERHSLLYEKLYKILLPVCLGLPLLLLLANFVFLQYYTNYQRNLRQEYAHYQSSHRKLQELKNQFEKSIALSGHYSSNLYGFFSIYADRMAALVNGRVNIGSMVFHPVNESRGRNMEGIAFMEEIVEIEGTCRDPIALNLWLKDLVQLVFVDSIFDQVYDYDDNLQTGTFKVRIKTTQDGLEQLQ